MPALAIDPLRTSTVYAGGPMGVFRSEDGGAHWSALNAGLGNPYVTALAIDPQSHLELYAGIDGGGAYTMLYRYVRRLPLAVRP